MKDQIQPALSMTEPPDIPEAYRKTIINFLAAYYGGRRWEMQENFGFHQLPPLTNDQLLTRPLAHQLAQIARAAAGQIQDPDDLTRGTIHEGIQGLMESLFAPYGVGAGYKIPATFWDSPLGQMVSRALLWLKGDELITLAEAAEIRGVSVPAISRAVQNGRLTRYVDPDAPKRQGRTLVSRVQVEEMGKEGKAND